jgi:ribosomal protein L29
MGQTIIVDLRSPEQKRAAAIADTEEARARQAQIHRLATHEAATRAVYDNLVAEQASRNAPHLQRVKTLRETIAVLETLVEADEAAIEAIDNDLAPRITAAGDDQCAAWDALWDARQAAKS